MLAAYAQIQRIRAERMLDQAQAAAYPHMGQGAKRWLDETIDRAMGIVSQVAEAVEEQLHWNGKVVSIRGFKRQAQWAWGKAVGR
jgi:uncharacterized membrane protein